FSEFANNRTLLSFLCSKCNKTLNSTSNDYFKKKNCVCCDIDEELVFETCISIHGHYYEYLLYDKDQMIITLRCPKHDVLDIKYRNHVELKEGCSHCLMGNMCVEQNNLTDFIIKSHHLHNFNYQYGKVHNFDNHNEDITITCPKHGD